MPKINVLDKSIFNLIAAGEVVEKPASVVKELVENSIDSGATNITINILSGGIEKIEVIDNGCGIEKDDLKKAFLPHATSKIATKEDLEKIGTLGFRGEALSSISSVSNTTIISKTLEQDTAYSLNISAGTFSSIIPASFNNGTKIIIENLFYNVPARAKFLRKPQKEESEITNIVSRLILANPSIIFKYVADEKLIYQSNGTDLKDAIYIIYGKNTFENLVEFNYSYNKYNFSGYICKPHFSKPNRTYQSLFINGRYVINQTISTAIYKAYEMFMMKNNFPFFVLNINIPLDEIDVNVHPNKLDVKFENSNELFKIIYNSVYEKLMNISEIKNIDTSEILFKQPNYEVNKDLLSSIDINQGSEFINNNINTDNVKEINLNDENISSNINFIDNLKNLSCNINEIPNKMEFYLRQREEINNIDTKNIVDDSSNNVEKSLNNIENVCLFNTSYKIVGTLFNTYILIEQGNNLLFIDQHAGHERLLYDKFCSQINNKDVVSQQLLIPFVLELSKLEFQYIKDNIITFNQLGFKLDEFGNNSFKIEEIPLLFNQINIQDFFNEILCDIDNNLVTSKSIILKDYLAKCACKQAIKGHDKISTNEIEILINELNKNNQVLLCPHGRPIAIKLNNQEIEKLFKRLV